MVTKTYQLSNLCDISDSSDSRDGSDSSYSSDSIDISGSALTVWKWRCIKDLEDKDHWLTIVSACRTALFTAGLIKT